MAAAPKMTVHETVNEDHPAINSILGANPFIDLQPKQLLGMVAELGRFLSSRPDSVMSRMGQLAIDLVQIGMGNSEIAPAASDKRFADPAFAQNPDLQAGDAELSRVAQLAARPRAGGPEHPLAGCRATALRHHADYRSARADQHAASAILAR